MHAQLGTRCAFGCCTMPCSQGGQDRKLESPIGTLVLSDVNFVGFEALNSSFKVVAFLCSSTGVRGKKPKPSHLHCCNQLLCLVCFWSLRQGIRNPQWNTPALGLMEQFPELRARLDCLACPRSYCTSAFHRCHQP